MTDLLMPPAYDVVWSVVVLAQLVLLGMALVRWFRARTGGGGGLLELLAIVLVPVLGPATYLLAQRGAAAPDRSTSGG